jgi:hypothetical protein
MEKADKNKVEESCGFCNRDDIYIKKDIENDDFEDWILTNKCCWKKICSINYHMDLNVDWQELCRRRGRLF